MAKKRELRVKHHKALVKEVRRFNKSIENDNLWKGRFYLRLLFEHFEKFDDGSGGIIYAILRYYDKKTGFYKDYTLDYMKYPTNLFNSQIWMKGNDFITKDANIWGNENPYEDNTDYRKVRI